jgi:hypothetical protein
MVCADMSAYFGSISIPVTASVITSRIQGGGVIGRRSWQSTSVNGTDKRHIQRPTLSPNPHILARFGCCTTSSLPGCISINSNHSITSLELREEDSHQGTKHALATQISTGRSLNNIRIASPKIDHGMRRRFLCLFHHLTTQRWRECRRRGILRHKQLIRQWCATWWHR